MQCPVCCDSSVKCSKCEIKYLKNEVNTLRRELSKYYTSDITKFTPNFTDKFNSTNFITRRQCTPFEYNYETELSNSFFITITFDPAKFGLYPYEAERKQYIINSLYKIMKDDLIKKCYGCFEYHNNGIIHSHLIANIAPDDAKLVKRKLKEQFTDNLNNKIVVDIGKAKFPNAKEYIEKESEDYYLITPKNNNNTKNEPSKALNPLDA
jgi:hypothetical protein